MKKPATPKKKVKALTPAEVKLRDEFALSALNGLISKAPFLPAWQGEDSHEAKVAAIRGKIMPGMATAAYAYADAMLKARKE
jgi:hypothetical protein